jgi:hypothetical protein
MSDARLLEVVRRGLVAAVWIASVGVASLAAMALLADVDERGVLILLLAGAIGCSLAGMGVLGIDAAVRSCPECRRLHESSERVWRRVQSAIERDCRET